jgi:hypothetical protein
MVKKKNSNLAQTKAVVMKKDTQGPKFKEPTNNDLLIEEKNRAVHNDIR